jgi:hypothetical protein
VRYELTFVARLRGEKRMRRTCTASVEAKNRTEAVLKCFQTHELISDVTITEGVKS